LKIKISTITIQPPKAHNRPAPNQTSNQTQLRALRITTIPILNL